MEPRIDHAVCSGHGRCYTLAPEIFEPDDEGFGLVKVGAVPPELEGAVKIGIANCPERAISMTN